MGEDEPLRILRPESQTSTRDRQSAVMRAAAQKLVATSRSQQGLPPSVTDPAVLGRIATLLRETSE